MNRSLVAPLYPEDRVFNKYNKGLIEAVVRGFYETKYTGFYPDSLEKPLTFLTFAESLIKLRDEVSEDIEGTEDTNSAIKNVDNIEGDEDDAISDEFEPDENAGDALTDRSPIENEVNKERGYEIFYERAGKLIGLDFAVEEII